MQIILVVAAVVSLLIKEWSTAVLLVAADGAERGGRAAAGGQGRERHERAQVDDEGDRPGAAGRAESRRSRPSSWSSGDVVLIAAGDQVPADGRIIAASSLQIDESALTGESTPAAKDADTLPGRQARPGRPDQHGVHEHAGHPRQRHDDRHRHRRRHRAGEDLRDAVGHGQGAVAADQGAQQAHPVDRGGGRPDDDRDVRPRPPARPGLGRPVRQRGLAGHRGHPRGAAHGDADDPVARRRRPGQAQRHREGPALGRDAGVHLGDQLRQDRHADDEPDDRGRGGRPDRPLHDLRHRLRPGGQGPSRGGLDGHASRTRSCPTWSPATPSWWTARSSATPPRAPCWCSATRPGWTSTPPASGCPGWPRCRSTPPTS